MLQQVFHPFPPVWDEHSAILILGSFPSVQSRQNGFYYGNPNNRFWAVLKGVFEEAVPSDTEGRKRFLLSHRIALWDALASCEIKGSSDASIKTPVSNQLEDILEHAPVSRVLANGKLTGKIIEVSYKDKVIPKVILLPSTSPANASWSLERLIQAWKQALLSD